ncbi:MAG TPA: hypothetical protein VM888_00130, partial [Chitinophagaceae bacterium]|nr:hypothetical protein [Chitinophagaceae bacterium]
MPATTISTYTRDQLSQSELQQFKEKGFLGPYPLFNKGESSFIIRQCSAGLPNLFLPNTLA